VEAQLHGSTYLMYVNKDVTPNETVYFTVSAIYQYKDVDDDFKESKNVGEPMRILVTIDDGNVYSKDASNNMTLLPNYTIVTSTGYPLMGKTFAISSGVGITPYIISDDELPTYAQFTAAVTAKSYAVKSEKTYDGTSNVLWQKDANPPEVLSFEETWLVNGENLTFKWSADYCKKDEENNISLASIPGNNYNMLASFVLLSPDYCDNCDANINYAFSKTGEKIGTKYYAGFTGKITSLTFAATIIAGTSINVSELNGMEGLSGSQTASNGKKISVVENSTDHTYTLVADAGLPAAVYTFDIKNGMDVVGTMTATVEAAKFSISYYPASATTPSTTYSTTLEDAFTAAPSNIDISKPVAITLLGDYEGDDDEHDISIENDVTYNVDFKTNAASMKGKYNFRVKSGALSITGDDSKTDMTSYFSVSKTTSNPSSLTIDGGKYTSTEDYCILQISQNSDIKIKGGTFKGAKSGVSLRKAEISGGSFIGPVNYGLNVTESTVAITGGTFKGKVAAVYSSVPFFDGPECTYAFFVKDAENKDVLLPEKYTSNILDNSVDKDVTVKKIYKIIYALNDGNTNTATITGDNPRYYYEENVTLPTPSRTGYEFAGWVGEGITVPTPEVTILATDEGNRTYTAIWTTTITAAPKGHYYFNYVASTSHPLTISDVKDASNNKVYDIQIQYANNGEDASQYYLHLNDGASEGAYTADLLSGDKIVGRVKVIVKSAVFEIAYTKTGETEPTTLYAYTLKDAVALVPKGVATTITLVADYKPGNTATTPEVIEYTGTDNVNVTIDLASKEKEMTGYYTFDIRQGTWNFKGDNTKTAINAYFSFDTETNPTTTTPKVTFNGGKYSAISGKTGVIYAYSDKEGAKITINDGIFNDDNTATFAIHIVDFQNFEFNGGTYSGSTAAIKYEAGHLEYDLMFPEGKPEGKKCFYYYDNDNREIALSRSDLTTNDDKLLCRIYDDDNILKTEVLKKVSVHSFPVPYISPSADGKTLTFKYDYKKKDSDYGFSSLTGAPDLPNAFNKKAVTSIVLDPSFAVYKPTSCKEWFSEFTSIKTLDLSKLDISEASNLTGMFQGCTSLNTIFVDAIKWAVKTGATTTNMFTGCTSIIGGEGTHYDADHTNGGYANVDSPTSTPAKPGYLTDGAEGIKYKIFYKGITDQDVNSANPTEYTTDAVTINAPRPRG
ncbi:MAG: InlB B-repeat-containing protein, partial [Bacteroidales bacterium]|nr:InlB B-repeat-containing protein [Bacteroidales bacterium]